MQDRAPISRCQTLIPGKHRGRRTCLPLSSYPAHPLGDQTNKKTFSVETSKRLNVPFLSNSSTPPAKRPARTPAPPARQYHTAPRRSHLHRRAGPLLAGRSSASWCCSSQGQWCSRGWISRRAKLESARGEEKPSSTALVDVGLGRRRPWSTALVHGFGPRRSCPAAARSAYSVSR